MTRLIRGSVVLAACVGVLSCTGGDPTSGSPGTPDKIVALPGIVFVNAGSTQLISFQLLDDNTGQIPTTWSVGATPAGFNVAIDSTFRPVYNPDGSLTLPSEQTELRATITGLIPSSGSFVISASGKSLTIPVTVIHAVLPATFNTTTPDIGQELVLTMPAGLSLQAGATYSATGAAAPIVVSQAADGSSATLLVAPGTSAPIRVVGITPDYAPGVTLSLSTSDTIIATNASTFIGTDDPNTAPLITLPAIGDTLAFYDIPAVVDQFYKIVLTDTTTITVNTDWADHDADIDQLWVNSAISVINCDACTGSAPEESTVTLAPGTYYFVADIYDGDPGAWYKFTITVNPNP
jgi:hypothetical protein